MAFYVSRISMRHVRSFGELDLDLTIGSGAGSSTPRLHTILIGENGTGKTTLLRAIAVGLADEKDTSGLLAESTGQFVAEGAPQATIELELLESGGQEKRETLTTVIKSENGQDVLGEKKPGTFGAGLVCGYGVSRANEGSDTGRVYRVVDSVYTLFNPTEPLIGTELGLRRLKDFLGSEWYPRVMESIKEALGLDSAVTITLVKGGGVRVSGPGIGKDIPLEGWADGYRMTLAWILDLYVWAMRAECITPTGDVTGIVLLDELEQHLHPSMQVGLPSRLSTLLPHVQIIATTHSPLVALGVEPDELVVLKRDGNNVLAHESVRDFHGYSVEDVLADPRLFDSAVYGPEVNEKLRRYRELASKPRSRRSRREESELKELGSELAAQQIPELRENPALRELQTILKKHNL
ncbi:MAG: AAA family ATPase [Gemmatimonadales bacterium]|nr:AAA family ATPase [Gemmatimonadales bacterium]NIQ98642.1 AAA family ATPase [Gemmatimonadales bacterium]